MYAMQRRSNVVMWWINIQLSHVAAMKRIIPSRLFRMPAFVIVIT